MASWRTGLSADLTRFLLVGVALCSTLYVVGVLGFAGAAYGALSGDPGPFFDTEVRSVFVEEASRMGLDGHEGADPYLADFFTEVVWSGSWSDTGTGGPYTYMAGESLIFYRVVQAGASGIELRFLDCHESLRLFRAAKLAVVAMLLVFSVVFMVLGRRLAEAVEGERALSDEITGLLLHDIKTPLAALLVSGGWSVSGTLMYSEDVLDELADAFDRLLILRNPVGGEPCATDAREVVFDVARLADRDAEKPGGLLMVDAPESARIVCDERCVVAVLYCVTKAALAEADGYVRLFVRSGAPVTLGVLWEVAAGVPGNEALASLIKCFSAAGVCEAHVETDTRRRRVLFAYPVTCA